MKILYFDCSNGISGDMLLKAAADLSGRSDEIYEKINEAAEHGICGGSHHEHGDCCGGHGSHGADGHDHHDHGHHGHGRSYDEVKRIIAGSRFPEAAKAAAAAVYANIARAEAKVHGATLETVHFHEVGRDEAIINALATGMAVSYIDADEICTSAIYDGKGAIVCSHGEISVPVPAVMALRENCSYDFRTADVNTEMVTPSGLAGLMGIGAEPVDPVQDLLAEAKMIKETEAKGGRDTGRPGLKAYILEK